MLTVNGLIVAARADDPGRGLVAVVCRDRPALLARPVPARRLLAC